MDQPRIPRTRKDRFKQFVDENRDRLLVASSLAVGSVVYVAACITVNNDAKKQKAARIQRLDETIDWLNNERDSGNVVYQLNDPGLYLTVDQNATQEIIRK